MLQTPLIYLAGPEVFLPDPWSVAGRKQALCAAYGFAGLFPLEEAVGGEPAAGRERALAIYAACLRAMARCDLCIANLTPFRGPGGDNGTAWELGWMAAHDKPVFAYANDPGDTRARVERHWGPVVERDGRLFDRAGLEIEAFGLADNLMLEGAVARWSGGIVRRAVATEATWSDLGGFEACLGAAAGVMRPASP